MEVFKGAEFKTEFSEIYPLIVRTFFIGRVIKLT